MNLLKSLSVMGLLVLLNTLGFAGQSCAASASLYLTPGNASEQIGSDFTIYAGVNSGGNSINAIEATVNIPSNLAITGAGTGGSLCSVWVEQPTVSGSSVSFKCGIPSGTTASGNLISISLRAAAVGSGSAGISSDRVLAGPGLDVTGGTTGATYDVTPASFESGGGSSSGSGGTASNTSNSKTTTHAPTISSSTHPDQTAWYRNSNPAFNWTSSGGATGYSYVFDQNSDTQPGTSANTSGTTAAFTGQADGIWYFHVSAQGPGGWSTTSTYRVQIDTTAPIGLTIVTEPKRVADVRPMVSFVATDATSGVDHYQIRLGSDPFKTVTSPYTPATIKSGVNVFTVRAYDKAGNMVEGTAKITIKEIPAPAIVSPTNNTTLKLIQKLDILGTANPKTTVNITLDGTTIAQAVKVANNGKWKFDYYKLIFPGTHKIVAVAYKDGIESRPSVTIKLKIDPTAVSIFGQNVPVYLVIAVLLVVIALLVLLVVWLVVVSQLNYRRLKSRAIRNNDKTATAVDARLDTMRSKLRRYIQALTHAGGRDLKRKQRTEKDIATEIASAEQAVSQTIEEETKNL